MNRRGITLFGIVALAALLAAGWFGWSYAQAMMAGAKVSEAQKDLKMLSGVVKRFLTIEGRTCETLLELEAKYLSTVRGLRDPWGKPYAIVPAEGYVYSNGPDRKHSADGADGSWDDDLYAWFLEEEAPAGESPAQTPPEEPATE